MAGRIDGNRNSRAALVLLGYSPERPPRVCTPAALEMATARPLGDRGPSRQPSGARSLDIADRAAVILIFELDAFVIVV